MSAIRSAVRSHIIEHNIAAICEIFPIFRRMRMLTELGGDRGCDTRPFGNFGQDAG